MNKIFKTITQNYYEIKKKAINYKFKHPKHNVFIVSLKKNKLHINHKYQLVRSKVNYQPYSIIRIY